MIDNATAATSLEITAPDGFLFFHEQTKTTPKTITPNTDEAPKTSDEASINTETFIQDPGIKPLN